MFRAKNIDEIVCNNFRSVGLLVYQNPGKIYTKLFCNNIRSVGLFVAQSPERQSLGCKIIRNWAVKMNNRSAQDF